MTLGGGNAQDTTSYGNRERVRGKRKKVKIGNGEGKGLGEKTLTRRSEQMDNDGCRGAMLNGRLGLAIRSATHLAEEAVATPCVSVRNCGGWVGFGVL